MQIKSPDKAEEFDQIHRLNYQTFVEEIPQHEKNNEKKRVDPFHSTNQYLIAKDKEQVIGMVSYNTHRPFSLELKGVNIDSVIPKKGKIAEVRLLSIEKKWRNTTVFERLMKELIRKMVSEDIHHALISATTRQMKLYRKLGFKSFGELVGKEVAYYQPMYITFGKLKRELVV